MFGVTFACSHTVCTFGATMLMEVYLTQNIFCKCTSDVSERVRMDYTKVNSIHQFFCTIYPTQCRRESRAYPRVLGEQGGGHPELGVNLQLPI